MILIGVCGRMRNGKDTIADYLVSKYAFVKKPMAWWIKEVVCKQIFNFTDEQIYGDKKAEPDERWKVPDEDRHYTPREIMQKVGTEMFRYTIHSDFWVICICNWIYAERSKNPDVRIVIPDIRFRNEVDNVLTYQDGKMLSVVREGIKVDSHISEHDLDDYVFEHFTLFNNGTIEDLHQMVDDYMQLKIFQ